MFLLLLAALTASLAAEMDADSLVREASILSSQGKLDAALALVAGADSSLPAPIAGWLRGRFELKGENSRKGLEIAASDSNPDSVSRGEAIFLLGQFHYAAKAFHFAIPRFREYLLRYPEGAWTDPAAFWMAYSCLEFARARPQKAAYLDTGLAYATRVEAHARSDASPPTHQGGLAPILSVKARLLLAKGDSAGAKTAMDEIRRIGSAAEISELGAASRKRNATVGGFPVPPITAKDSVAPESLRYTLQLGAFSQSANADQLRTRLLAKGVKARIEENPSGEKRFFRVLYGDFADAASAQQAGERMLAPLGYMFQVSPTGR